MAWRFRTFVSATGRNDVQKAVDKARPEVLEQFQVRVRYLAHTQKIDWHEPEAKKLQGIEDIYEIRFKAENRQHRPLGFFGPLANEFTIVVWAEKKQNIYKPADAIKTAGKRRKLILGGYAQTDPLLIDGEDFPPPGE